MLEFVYLFSWLKKKKKVKKNADNSNIEGEKKKRKTQEICVMIIHQTKEF